MADNITAPAAGSLLATKDVGGIHYPRNLITDEVGADAVGVVGASPAANTVLGRLKAIADAVTTLSGHVDGLEALAATLNGFVDGLETLIGTTNTSLTAIGGYVDGLETLQGTTNTTLTTLNGFVDGLEALLGGVATQATLAALSAKLPASLGAKAPSGSLSVAQAGLPYETVAAGQTAQVMGAAGAVGDFLSHIVVQPTSAAPGVVTILDNAVEVHAWPGGTVGADLKPFIVPVGAFSVSGAWKITTGANVKCTGYGVFT